MGLSGRAFESIMGVFCLNTEVIATGRTVEEAIETACQQLGAQRDEIEFEILTLPKKGFLGLKFTPAKVKVSKPFSKGECAANYLKSILQAMGFEQVKVQVKEDEEGAVLSLEGEDLGVIIGRRGETLDAVSYTHLDVYKRQFWCRAKGAAGGNRDAELLKPAFRSRWLSSAVPPPI